MGINSDVVVKNRFYFSKTPKQLTSSSSSSGSSSVDSSNSSFGSVDAAEFLDDDAFIDTIFAHMSPLRHQNGAGMHQSTTISSITSINDASNQSTWSTLSSNDEASRDTMLRFDGDAEDLEVQYAQVLHENNMLRIKLRRMSCGGSSIFSGPPSTNTPPAYQYSLFRGSPLQPPVQPPVHQPPVHQPPVHQPPVHQPPAHQPPAHQPPAQPPVQPSVQPLVPSQVQPPVQPSVQPLVQSLVPSAPVFQPPAAFQLPGNQPSMEQAGDQEVSSDRRIVEV